MNTVAEIQDSSKRKMQSALESLKKEFTAIRAGRATPAMLDSLKVDYYGAPTPISQLGTISAPEPQLLVINPWDKASLKEIEREILRANLGLTVSNDGNLLRVQTPPLTEERRKDLVKSIKKMGEDAKVAVRNVRRDTNEFVKKLSKDKKISQDEEKTALDIIQKSTDQFIDQVSDLVNKKEHELMTI